MYLNLFNPSLVGRGIRFGEGFHLRKSELSDRD